jgi:hypothetical protein
MFCLFVRLQEAGAVETEGAAADATDAAGAAGGDGVQVRAATGADIGFDMKAAVQRQQVHNYSGWQC